MNIHPEYIVDEKSNKKAVVITYNEWKKLLEALEELEDIKAYDLAKSLNDESISFDKVVNEIEAGI
jgi:hypothetical protein